MYLQLAMAEEFTVLSEQNFLEERRISPLRGRILARDGTVLADNRVAYDLMFWGGTIGNLERLAYLLDLTGEPRAPDRSKPDERRHGAVLAWNIPDRLIPAVEELAAGQPNLYLRERVERTYPTNLAAQVVGYTSAADSERFPGYGNDDLIGIMGIEASQERELFGSPGMKLVELDNRRVVLRSQELLPAKPGNDVVLTLDPRVQRLAEDALQNALSYVNDDRARYDIGPEEVIRGALIALDPRNGEILAMASLPTFDQNLFTKRPIDARKVNPLLNDTVNFPLSNRAVEAYPPASTFKLVTSSALLEKGYVKSESLFPCSAAFSLGGITWRNWHPAHKGSYTVKEAIADSCNTYFWHAVASTPNATKGWAPFIEDLVGRARELGYDHLVGVGLDEEKTGRVPDKNWVEAQPQYQHGWLPGFTLNTVIGQGDVLATPIQVAQLIATLALDGLQVKPHLVAAKGEVEIKPESRQISGRHWGTLKDAMRLMFTDFPSRYIMGPGVFPVDVAGKTGTAQTPRGEPYTHAWFMGYGPVEDPELAVVVFVENGGSSSRVSVPIARDFLAGYWGIER
jgi:penicillin-binding protein 2